MRGKTLRRKRAWPGRPCYGRKVPMTASDKPGGMGVPPMQASDKPGGMGVPPMQQQHGRDDRATMQDAIRIRQGAYLPHWTREGGIYFVTFRLADSLPQAVVKARRMEREEIIRRSQQQSRPLTLVEQRRLQEL